MVCTGGDYDDVVGVNDEGAAAGKWEGEESLHEEVEKEEALYTSSWDTVFMRDERGHWALVNWSA